MLRFLATVAALALVLASPSGAAAQGSPPGPEKPPRLDAAAWVLIDARSGDRLAGARANRSLPIASATKLMTARLALARLALDRKLSAVDYDPIPAESVLGLEPGESIEVRDLIVALMLPSANDAAATLATAVSGSVPAFVREMNREARRLELRRTSYANPIGLDDPANFSSAADLAALARLLREDPWFRRTVAKPKATLRSGSRGRTVMTRNGLLLSDPTVDGIKTGHTLGAGYVLVASAQRRGVSLISVVLAAPSEAARDRESARLLDYGFGLYQPRRVVRAGEELGEVPVAGGEGEALALLAGRPLALTVRGDQRIETELLVPDQVEGPIEARERIGRAVINVDGRRAARLPLLAAGPVAAPASLSGDGSPLATILIGGGAMLVVAALLVARLRPGSASTDRAQRTAEERMESRRRRASRRGGGGAP